MRKSSAGRPGSSQAFQGCILGLFMLCHNSCLEPQSYFALTSTYYQNIWFTQSKFPCLLKVLSMWWNVQFTRTALCRYNQICRFILDEKFYILLLSFKVCVANLIQAKSHANAALYGVQQSPMISCCAFTNINDLLRQQDERIRGHSKN